MAKDAKQITWLYWFMFFFLSFATVNNVGRMYDYPDELDKLTPDFLWSLMNINMGSVTMMTRMLVNGMKKEGKGAIVNISSGSELQPLPYAAVYGASKVRAAAFTWLFETYFSLFVLLHIANILFLIQYPSILIKSTTLCISFGFRRFMSRISHWRCSMSWRRMALPCNW